MKSRLRYVLLAVALVFFLFPITWIILTSFKVPEEFLAHPPKWIPKRPTLTHYVSVSNLGGYRALKNTLVIASFATAISIALGTPCAYSLARFNVGGKNLPLWFLSHRMLPPITVAFPAFLLFRSLGWIDTYQAIVTMHLTANLPYVIWMMRSFFKDIPVEIEESAQIDGCSIFQVFWKISLPLSAPGLIATAIFCFTFSWCELLFGLVLSRTEVVPLSVQLPRYFGQQMTFWGEIGALSTLSMLPIFTLVLLMQKFLVRGLTLGAIK
uniref:Carbohydrate ABC transporter permease n=1 Tax=Candidatus Caldatribacterium saccharofermentans TaxID=1454753 RepID=A0A7V4TK81_9BACT